MQAAQLALSFRPLFRLSERAAILEEDWIFPVDFRKAGRELRIERLVFSR